MGSMRGPNAWIVEADGSLDVSVGCRTCGWASEYRDVPEARLHLMLDAAARDFTQHQCRKFLTPIGEAAKQAGEAAVDPSEGKSGDAQAATGGDAGATAPVSSASSDRA
jgi:hypothetical protein